MNNDTVISEFNKQFGHLKKYGLKVHGIGNLISDHNVISISTPFIFDRTKLPDNFMGFDLRDGTPENEMPSEFKTMTTIKNTFGLIKDLKIMLIIMLTLFVRHSTTLK